MKSKLITPILLIFFFPVTVIGQGKIRLYVYAQRVLPGARQITATMGDPNPVEKKPEPKTNYFIYLWQKKSTTLQPSEIWLNKKSYTISVEAMPDEPVVINRSEKGTRTLVPGGGGKILRIVLTGPGDPDQELSKKLQRCLQRGRTVLAYRYHGKTRYVDAKKILALESLPMQ